MNWDVMIKVVVVIIIKTVLSLLINQLVQNWTTEVRFLATVSGLILIFILPVTTDNNPNSCHSENRERYTA
jgi:hypothetical protein